MKYIQPILCALLVSVGIMMLPSCSNAKVIEATYAEFRYTPDVANEWKTPEQTLAEGGDCEDFVILLRHRLIEAGVSEDKIELLHGKHKIYGHHMVLRYKGVFYDTYGPHKFYPEFSIQYAFGHKLFMSQVGKHN